MTDVTVSVSSDQPTIELGGNANAVLGGTTLTNAGLMTKVTAAATIGEANVTDAVSGAVLSITATLTGARALTLPDQDVTISAYGASLIDDADAATARTTLGLVIGTDVQAWDAGLDSISGLTTAADKMIYTTALDTYAVADLTSYARTLLDDADAATARTTLGLGTLATQNTIDNGDWSGADLEIANGGTGASTASAARTALGLAIGTDVQAYDADLDAVAALASTGIAARTAANTWAQRTITGTANEITVTNGDGVSGDPTISLPSAITLTGKTITGGSATGMTSVSSTAMACTTLSALVSTLTLNATQVDINTTSNGDINLNPDGTGVVATSKLDCDGGAIDGTPIGAATPSTVAATTVTASGLITADGGVTVGNTSTLSLGSTTGKRIILFDTTNDFALGVESGEWRCAVNVAGDDFTWGSNYASFTERMRLSNAKLDIALTTDSTSTSTGALVVDGGVGSAKSVWAGGPIVPGVYTVATLPAASSYTGGTAYVSNGRKTGEGAGAGTGLQVYSDGTNWIRPADDTTVAA